MLEITKSQTLHGLVWSLAERIGQQSVQFILSIILARLLLPEEFGMIAMLWLFISLSQALLDSGFGSALIRKQDATRLDESSIFYFNIVLGVVVAGLLTLSAPLIAGFYEIPRLVPIVGWMSINLIINSFGVVQTALMTKRVEFKSQMKASVIATVISGIIGVYLAYRGAGVYSLVVQAIAANLLRTALLWKFNSWRPLWNFSLKSLGGMFPYGSKILATSMINTVFYNIYYLVIGKLFSPVELGFYSRAHGTQQLPVQHILTATVARVAFPVFASMQQDIVKLKRVVRKAMVSMSLITFPLMTGIALTAKPMVLVLLTEKWLPCVPYLQLLCIAGCLFPIQQVGLNNLKAQGRSDLYFRIEVQTKILIVLAIFTTYRYGIIPMIYGQIITSIAAYAITGIQLRKILGYSLREQTNDLLPGLAVTIAMAGLVYSITLLDITNQLILLTAQVAGGVIAFFTLCHMFKLSSFSDLIGFLKDSIGNNGKISTNDSKLE